MSEPIQNNAIKNLQNIQKMRSESMQEYHKKVDEQARIREQEKIKTHNKERSELNELMVKLYHQRLDRLATYNRFATIVKPQIDQGKFINLEA
jgi:hypothetical protein|tara:strand:+ start:465 stop:743 length:279 start_codon:yes stop_codon:yes gene_type:complete